LSRLSLGCATFGREINKAEAHELMDHALARGITHFDTAAAYSAGASEQIVGSWLASHRSSRGALTVATKIRPPYTPREIEDAVAASAGRLGVDTIDLLYLHKWDPAVETPATLSTLDDLVRTGRVRALGASNFDAAQLGAAHTLQTARGLSPFRFVQNNHNLAVRDVDEAMLALCRAHEIAIVTYSPLGAGFLTGKHRTGVQPGSRFAIVPGHQDIYFQPLAEKRLEHLADLAARTGRSMTELALIWTLHQPGITSTLIGGRRAPHLEQAFVALADNDSQLIAALDAC
jgi:1-deoxyxylulose-5-phosphate synthase